MNSPRCKSSHAAAILAALSLTAFAWGGGTVLTTELVASGFTAPLWAGSPPGDTERLFVVEQETGRVRIINLADGSINAKPFLNIDDLVINTGNERGLLGFTFHPDYADNRFFYVHYNDNSGTSVLARYQTLAGDPDGANHASAKIILTRSQPFSNNNGGMIAFGPNDGYLYMGFGDGGSRNDPGNRAQNRQLWLGKMLRIDVNVDPDPYFIPPDNPFVGDPSTLDEIWALGLRNPWRWSFDRDTGDLYIGDVGQIAREEINFQPGSSTGGENYGWRCMEGLMCTGLSGCTCDHPELTLPIRQYSPPRGRAVIGGYVYRGAQICDLRGTYFYADYISNRIWSFRVVDGDDTEFQERTAELQPPGGGLTSITSFGEDGAGEMYIVSRNGRIFKIVPAGLALGDMNGDCICPWDIDASGDVGVKDLLILLGAWGPCPKKEDCPADFDTSGDVGVKDLLFLLGNWGPCP